MVETNHKEKKEKELNDMDNTLCQVLDSSGKEVTNYITYINFGILIALYHLENSFMKEFKLAVVATAILAGMGLFIDYAHNQIYIWCSLKALKEKDINQKKIKYDSLHSWGNFFSILNIFTLGLSVFIFSTFVVSNKFFPCN